MEKLAFHTLLTWKMIILPILTTSLIHFFFKRLGECTFWAYNGRSNGAPLYLQGWGEGGGGGEGGGVDRSLTVSTTGRVDSLPLEADGAHNDIVGEIGLGYFSGRVHVQAQREWTREVDVRDVDPLAVQLKQTQHSTTVLSARATCGGWYSWKTETWGKCVESMWIFFDLFDLVSPWWKLWYIWSLTTWICFAEGIWERHAKTGGRVDWSSSFFPSRFDFLKIWPLIAIIVFLESNHVNVCFAKALRERHSRRKTILEARKALWLKDSAVYKKVTEGSHTMSPTTEG